MAGKASQNNPNLLETLIDIIPTPVFYKDKDGIYRGCNEAFAGQILGLTKEKIIGCSLFDLPDAIPSDLAQIYHEKDNELIINPGTQSYETQVQCADGFIRTFLFNKTTYTDAQGDIAGMIGIMTDITARKRSENALKESREKYNFHFEKAPLGYQSLDTNGHLLEVNPTWLDMLGYTRKEVVGKSFADFLHPDWKNHFKENFPRFKAVGEIPAIEFKMLKKDGSSILVSIAGKVGQDEKGKFKQTHCILHDITKQRQAEDALRKSEARYKTLFDTMHDGVAIYRSENNGRDFIFVDFNKAAEKIENIKKEDLVGKSVLEMFPGVKDFGLLDIFQRVWKTGKPEHFPIAYYKDDRISGWRDNYIYKLDSEEVVAIYTDETGRKQMEAEKARLQTQLQQAQKMEAIGTLAGGIAHDFNNILAPIIGCTEMALEDASNDTFLYENLQAVLKAGMRAKDLVQQILTFSRQTDQELKPLRVQTIIKEVLKLARSTLPTTIQFQQHINNQCGLVMVDATQIHQVAMNLITNAYHAMEEIGGKLTVTLKEVELTAGDLKNPDMIPGPYVRLSVGDTGTGMERSVIERIFEPYFTTKEKEKGTGLGLSVVHGIVKGFGGDIRVCSEPGKGTTFHVYLPVIKTEAETLELTAAAPVLGGTERILLVDDEDQIIRMEKQMLERLGYQITARTGSIEALEVFRKDPDQFDLIISDMTMPNMTGLQLAQKLFQIRPNIPVIICSGFSEKMDTQKAKALGICGYVMKPVVKRELAKKIREALDYRD